MSVKPYLLAAALLLAGALAAPAQTPGTGGPQPGPDPVTPDPTQVPLDGGASLLLAAGVGYGLQCLRSRKAARQ